jgi:hypothetical protein
LLIALDIAREAVSRKIQIKNRVLLWGKRGPIDFQFSFIATCLYAFLHVLPNNLQGDQTGGY